MTRVAGWTYFIAIQLISLLCTMVGLILLIPLASFHLWIVRPSKYFIGRDIPVWRGGYLTWIWGNEEDGVIGNVEQRSRIKDASICAYYWSAIRNPTNNLRFIFRWIGGPFWRWENAARTFYLQAGWYPNGYPVLSAGRM